MFEVSTEMELKVIINDDLHEIAPSWGNPNPKDPEIELTSVKVGETEILHELDDIDKKALSDECMDDFENCIKEEAIAMAVLNNQFR